MTGLLSKENINKHQMIKDMNKQTIITALIALVSLGASAQLESVKELSMKSEYFNHERQVLIYTPGSYQQYDQTYYDVI